MTIEEMAIIWTVSGCSTGQPLVGDIPRVNRNKGSIVPQSLAHLFIERVEKSGSMVALRYKENKAPYRDMSWSDLLGLVKSMAFGLAALGLKPGDRVAIIAPTSYQWVASDLSIITAGGVSAAIYPTSSSADIEFILNNSEARLAFVYNETILNRFLKVRYQVAGIEKLVLLTAPASGKSLTDLSLEPGLVIGLEELLEAGRAAAQDQPNLIDERLSALSPEKLATIIYTSGTTGTPKGVMLTHHNILSVLVDMPEVLPLDHNDIFLSFLPLSHVFERVAGEYYWIFSGCVCAYAEGIESVAKNMREIEPTVMLVVPRILDKVFVKVKAGIEGASRRARRLIDWSINVGREVQAHKNTGKEMRRMLRAKYWLAEKLVLRKLRERIGSRLRCMVSGGAPANAEVVEFFNVIGIPVLEGYGLTETAAPTNVNRLHKNKFGTVGPTLKSVEMKLGEDGEICFKGPGIFSGYYKADDMTKEVFADGWFHTGDIGHVDEDGYLKITDRKKDIIVNSSGKNIAPLKIECLLRSIPIISQSVVFGDRIKSLVAILTLDEQATLDLAREKNWTFKDYDELLNGAELRGYLREEIEKVSKDLSDCERVQNFAILPRDLSVEEGELTATLKVKRSVLKTKHKDLVNSLHRETPIITPSSA
jgi:long-chain acyl-CoA synthetase